MNESIEPIEESVEELKEKYPEGTIVLVGKEDSPLIGDELFRAVVTSHSTTEQTETVKLTYPGARINVSTDPPNYRPTDADISVASACRPCEILDTFGEAVPVPDGDGL